MTYDGYGRVSKISRRMDRFQGGKVGGAEGGRVQL